METNAQSENPFEAPSPKGIRIVQATLKVTLAIQCWGYAAGHLHLGRTDLFLRLMQPHYSLTNARVEVLSDYTAYYLIACGVICLLRPIWLLLIPVIVWQAGTATAALLLKQGDWPTLEPALQATRIVVPMSLMLVDFWPPRMKPTLAMSLSCIRLLRLATVTTFLALGIQTLYQVQYGGNLFPLAQRCCQSLFNQKFEVRQLQQILGVIGIIEIVLAVTFITSRNRLIAFCMTVWGLALAASYSFAFRFEGYDVSLIQIANAGAPFTVMLFWMAAYREQQPIILPDVESPE